MEKIIRATDLAKEGLSEDIPVVVAPAKQIHIQKKEKKACKNCKGSCCAGDRSGKIQEPDMMSQNKKSLHEQSTDLL